MDRGVQEFARSIHARGWAITQPILDAPTIAALRAEMVSCAIDGRGGACNLLDDADVRALSFPRDPDTRHCGSLRHILRRSRPPPRQDAYPCGPDNGPVRVIDSSHRLGRLSGSEIDRLRRMHPERDCAVAEGGVLGFRPLLLHASAPSAGSDPPTSHSHRAQRRGSAAASELAFSGGVDCDPRARQESLQQTADVGIARFARFFV
jgi:hypothetical protein